MKKLLAFLFAFAIFASLASPVFAQEDKLLRENPGDCLYNAGGGERVVTIECVPYLFANLIYWLLIFSGTVALFFVMFGGIKILTSNGDAKNLESARKTITWALVGLVTILLSFAILTFIAQTTGIGCISNFGFDSCTPNDRTGDRVD